MAATKVFFVWGFGAEPEEEDFLPWRDIPGPETRYLRWSIFVHPKKCILLKDYGCDILEKILHRVVAQIRKMELVDASLFPKSALGVYGGGGGTNSAENFDAEPDPWKTKNLS